jgi:hypothetical protein
MKEHECGLARACRALGLSYMKMYWLMRGTRRYESVKREIPDSRVREVTALMRSGWRDLNISESLGIGINRVNDIRHGRYKPEVSGALTDPIPSSSRGRSPK